MTKESLHEPREQLSDTTLNMHRAIESLMEEFEAVDWYQQRAEVTSDPELKKILEHNRDEEMEHAVMMLEWLRRQNATLDDYLRSLLFADDDDVVEAHHGEPAASSAGAASARINAIRVGKLSPKINHQ